MKNKNKNVLHLFAQILLSIIILTVFIVFIPIFLVTFAVLINLILVLYLFALIYAFGKRKKEDQDKNTNTVESSEYLETLLSQAFRDDIITRREYKQIRNNKMARNTTELLKQSYIDGIIDDEQFDELLNTHLLLKENMRPHVKQSKNVMRSRS
jgi:predicted membrane protein